MSEPMTIDVRVEKDDGGPVYPASEFSATSGMTVRQLYVGQALALFRLDEDDWRARDDRERASGAACLARSVVAIADALIEEEARTRVAVRTVSRVVDEE